MVRYTKGYSYVWDKNTAMSRSEYDKYTYLNIRNVRDQRIEKQINIDTHRYRCGSKSYMA